MSQTPNRQVLRERQNEILSKIVKGMEKDLECHELQTKILQKKADNREKRKVAAQEMIEGTRTIRALVADVDDNVFNMARDELGLINGTKFEVTKATSYDQVVSALEEKRFDIVLLDCHSFIDDQPFALIKKARKNQSHVPVIVYGPEGSYECDKMALEAGAADYLTKEELTAKRLEKSIRYCLSRANRL